MFIAQWVIAHNLATLSLVFLYLVETHDLRAIIAFNSKAVNDLLDHATGSSDLDVLVANRTVFIENEPVLDAELAEEFVTVVTFFSLSAHL